MTYGKSEVSGVGGWLAIFLVTFALILPVAPIVVIVRGVLGHPAGLVLPGLPGWLSYRLVSITCCAAQVMLCWLVTWRLFRVRRWSSVRFAIVGMLLVAPGFVVLDMVAATVFFGLPVDALPRAYASGMARAAAYSVIWITYFLRSQRVANTYPRPNDEDRLTAVFS
jgi:hypothetical protein